MRRDIQLDGDFHEVIVSGHAGEQLVGIGAAERQPVSLRHRVDQAFVLEIGPDRHVLELVTRGETVCIKAFGRHFTLTITDPVERAAARGGNQANRAKAPMPGVVVEILVEPGAGVTRGETIMTIESMKIVTHINAWRDGVITLLPFVAGDAFDKDAVLVTLEAPVEPNPTPEA